MQHSDLDAVTGEIKKSDEQPARDVLIVRVEEALRNCAYELAGELLALSGAGFEGDLKIAGLYSRQRAQARAFEHVQELLSEARDALAGQHFVQAVSAYREGANLSRRLPVLRERAFDFAVEEAQFLTERNWRVAEALLNEAAQLGAGREIPAGLLQEIAQAARDESTGNVLAEVESLDNLEDSRARLAHGLNKYPGDPALTARMSEVDAALAQQRDLADRETRWKRLLWLKADFERTGVAEDAEKLLGMCEAVAGPYRADARFAALLDEIEQQTVSCRRASEALSLERISDCLEECARALEQIPEHHAFSTLREQARSVERSRLSAHIREVLENGPLIEAAEECKRALAMFPQSYEFRALALEISEKEDEIRSTLESGQRALAEKDFSGAAAAFLRTRRRLPLDRELTDYIAEALRSHARVVQETDPAAAAAALDLVSRVETGEAAADWRIEAPAAVEESPIVTTEPAITGQETVVSKPAPRRQALQPRARTPLRSVAAGQRARPVALVKVARVKKARTPAKRPFTPGLRGVAPIAAALAAMVIASVFAFRDRHPRVVDERVAAVPEIPPAAPPAKPVTQTAKNTSPPRPVAAAKTELGGLTVHSNVDDANIFVGSHKYAVSRPSGNLSLRLVPGQYVIHASRKGYQDAGNVVAHVSGGDRTSVTLFLEPKPATLEIRGKDLGTVVKVDGTLLGALVPGKALTSEISPGSHTVELSRAGYLTKLLNKRFTAGEKVRLTGREIQLESSDASTVTRERQDWARAVSSKSERKLAAFASKYPASTHAGDAKAEIERLDWEKTNKQDAASLRAFAAKYPGGIYSGSAREELEGLNRQKAAQLEESEWAAADKANRAALTDFLRRYPTGPHAGVTANLLTGLSRQPAISEEQSADDSAWRLVNVDDRESLESYLKGNPSGKHHAEANQAIAALTAKAALKKESNAVLSVISRFATAWNSKDVDLIVAIEHDLDRRTLRAQLSPVKRIVMTIAPVSAPQIDGAKATVICRRQADETFSDGSRKKNPAAIVTYVLAKQDGVWAIQGTQ